MPISFDIPQSKIFAEKNKLFPEDKYNPLTHQVNHYNALTNSTDLVINTSPPGSGKTNAALYPLIYFDKHVPITSRGSTMFTIIITPINSILQQITSDIQKFVDQYHIDYAVFPINKYTLDIMGKLYKERKSHGELLFDLFNTPISMQKEMHETLNIYMQTNKEYKVSSFPKRIVYIINPDIMYGTLFDVFYKNSANIKGGLFLNTEYLIFDEFHYYSCIQMLQFFVLVSTFNTMGRFNTNGQNLKISLLSATPNKKIIEFVKSIGISYAIIDKGKENKTNELVPFLAKKSMVFIEEKNGKIENIIDYEKLKRDVDEGKYTLIICNTLRSASEIHLQCVKYFGDDNVGKITGNVSLKHRAERVNRQIIIATSTVDIGYNFDRIPKPDRQTIDVLYVSFKTMDEFNQRDGRGGRILGKKEISHPTEVYVIVSPSEFKKITEKKEEITCQKERDSFMKCFEDIFKEKDDYYAFFKMYGMVMVNAFLSKLKYDAKDQNFDIIIEKIYSQLEKIFPEDGFYISNKYLNTMGQYMYFSSKEYNKLNKEKDIASLIISFLFNNSYHFFNSHIKNGAEIGKNMLIQKNKIEKDCSDAEYKKILKSMCDKKEIGSILNEFSHNYEYMKLCSQYFDYISNFVRSFRGQFRGSKFQYQSRNEDDQGLLGETDLYIYNFFHILLYYDYEIIKDKYNREIVKIMGDEPLDPPRKFGFHAYSEINLSEFSDYTLQLIQNNILELEVTHDIAECTIPNEFRKMLKESHIAYFLPIDYYWTYSLQNLKKFIFKIRFKNADKDKEYCVLFDTDALIAQSIIKQKQEDAKKT